MLQDSDVCPGVTDRDLAFGRERRLLSPGAPAVNVVRAPLSVAVFQMSPTPGSTRK